MKHNINHEHAKQWPSVEFVKNKTMLVSSASVLSTMFVGILGYILFWIRKDSQGHPEEMPDGIGIGIIIFIICTACAIIHSVAVFGLTDPTLLPEQFEKFSRSLARLQSILYAPTIGIMLLQAGPTEVRGVIVLLGVLYMAIYPAALGKVLIGVECVIKSKKYNTTKINIKSIFYVLIFLSLQGFLFMVYPNLESSATCSTWSSLLWCLCAIWVFHFRTRLVRT